MPHNNDLEARRKFLFILEWLLDIIGRYSGMLRFSLVHLEYGDGNELGGTYGAIEARNQLANMTASLQNAFRKADIVTRNGTDFWILVPYTSEGENIYDKIVNVMREANHAGLNIVDRRITIYPIPFELDAIKTMDEPNSGLALLEHLKVNHEKYSTHSFKLSANILS